MIFVTVGTQKFPFNRLLVELDALVESGFDEDEIFAQIGCSDYVPQNYEYVKQLSKEEFDACMRRCKLLITHGGVATIATALKYRKPVIVVPRLARYGEHVDDHQEEIAETFSTQNYVLKHRDGEKIGEEISQAQSCRFACYISKREMVMQVIKDYIRENFD